jgi:hypothetical protein
VSSGGASRHHIVAGRRRDLPEVTVLKEVGVAGEQESTSLARNAELRDIGGANRGDVPNRLGPIAENGLEEELLVLVSKQDPGVPAVLGARWHAPPDDEIGVDA